jgi:hypothetical protein
VIRGLGHTPMLPQPHAWFLGPHPTCVLVVCLVLLVVVVVVMPARD